MNYEEARKFIAGANEKAGEMGIEAIGYLLDSLGHPERKLKFIHVGGTNGKGSISAYIAYMLANAGYKVGRYISPTVREYRERIQCLEVQNDKTISTMIDETSYLKLTNTLKQVYEKMEEEKVSLPSEFELETVLGFLYFLQEQCDFVLLEVGMGGRIDATNVIEQSICTVFASISMDHMNFLGDTQEKIAMQKAGIIKENGTVVCYDYGSWSRERGEEDVISPVLQKVSFEKQAKLVFSDYRQVTKEEHSMNGIVFSYKERKDLKVSLLGDHQVKNAIVALEVVDALKEKGIDISEKAIGKGLLDTCWEGRFQVIRNNPYYIVDGAHNEDAARSLRRTIDMYLPDKKIACIVGILADKEYDKVLSYLAPKMAKMITITPDNPRALPAMKLKVVAEKYCGNVVVAETVEQGLEMIGKEDKEYDAILVFGSLYYLKHVYDYFSMG